jgi:hypothetical protein
MQIRNYEWVETTMISKGGEEKSRDQKSCYYGVDGVLQKVPVSHTAAESGGAPGILIPGKLINKAGKRKKEEIVEYMKNAAALIQSYIPPDPNRIQQSVNAGKMTMQPMPSSHQVRLTFGDYQKPGDTLSVDIETPTNRLVGMGLTSYLDSPEDAVTLQVTMGLMADGTIHADRTVLTAPAKDITVTIENTGYRKNAP